MAERAQGKGSEVFSSPRLICTTAQQQPAHARRCNTYAHSGWHRTLQKCVYFILSCYAESISFTPMSPRCVAYHPSSYIGSVLAAAMTTLTSCAPVDVSDPPSGSDLSAYLPASETSVLHLPSTNTVLAAYNDDSGAYDIVDVGGMKMVTSKAMQSLNGLSYSLDGGLSWTRHGPIPPASCGNNTCPTLLMGDPWLAATTDRVLYVSLAQVGANPSITAEPTAIALSTSLDGGLSWGTPTRAYWNGNALDKPSLSTSGNTAVVAFLSDFNQAFNLFLLTSENQGDTWASFPLHTPDDPLPTITTKMNPIVQLRSSTVGYVSYQLPNNGISNFGVRIVKMTRSGIGASWTASPTLVYGDSVNIDLAPPAALNKTWRDWVPTSFDVGEGGNHLYLTYRRQIVSNGTTKSVVTLADCVDNGPAACTFSGNVLSAGWRIQTFQPTSAEGGMYQPNVTASKLPRPNDTLVALSWYQQSSTDPANPKLEPHGVYSRNGGTGWGPVQDLNPATNPYAPCPIGNGSQGQPGGYYGDYFGSAILPPIDFTPILGPGSAYFPWVVTVYASSTAGCFNLPGMTYDQHVQGVVW